MINSEIGNKITYIKSCINKQGFITGFSVARLFNMTHESFHVNMCDYYTHHQTHSTEQPTIYRQDGTGFFWAMVSAFPYDITAMRADLGEPTYGFEPKHLLDLAAKFPEKIEIIDAIKQAFEEYESQK